MSARIIDGKALAARTRDQVAEDVKQLKQNHITPGLTVVLVGDDPASQVYVRNKAAACEKAGINSEIIRLPEDASEDRLLDTVRALNQNPDVHGILVQLPLPGHMNSANVIATIAPEKDVDGFHINNVGRLM